MGDLVVKGERRKLPRRQILSTESESECALSGECAGLDGGASNNINRRKNRLNRSLVTPSGDSADGELSEDEASGQSGDRTATSSTKKLHKKSPKKSHFSSFSRNRKVKGDRSENVTKKSLRIRDTSDENSEADSDEELLLNRNLSLKKQNSSSKILDTSSSESDEGEKDLNLRKRDEKPRKEDNITADEKLRKEEKLKKEERASHKEKRKSLEKEKRRRSDEYAKAKEGKSKLPPNDVKAKEPRKQSVSEHSDSMIMPELEPQVAPVAQPPPIKNSKELEVKSHLLPPKDEVKKSKSKDEKKEDRKKEQKSIKEFFLQKAQETSASSMDETNNGGKGVKREEKDKQTAIENNFGANKEYLTAFESFIKKDKSPKSKGPASPANLESEKAKAEAKKSFVLLASTLHPKKVVREEMKAEEKKRKDWEEKVKREEAEKRKLEEEERRGKKRKEREWEEQREREKEEQLKKEKSERKKKEKEEKKRQKKKKKKK